jgi:hypothetical protein
LLLPGHIRQRPPAPIECQAKQEAAERNQG